MAKPAITFRNTKGSPLTYTELDDNFNNLQDATINFTDGTNTLSMDLNDTTTIEGQRNMAITVNESTGKIVIKNNLSDYTREPMGFENRTDSVIDFDETTRVFTIYPQTTNYRFWVKGVEYVKTTSMTQTIPDTTGLYYFYMDAAGTLQYQLGYFDWDDQAPVAYVYWNATINEGLLADERHGIALDWATHEYLHRTRGAAYANGLGASNYVVGGDGSLDTHAQLDISNGTVFDEDLKIDITHSNSPTGNTYEQDLQGPGRFPVAYHSGSTGEWTLDASRDFPVKNGTSLVTYNLNTAGTWTTPDVTSGRYVAYWIVATNFLNTPVISIMGQREDSNIGNAETNNLWTDLDLTNFPNTEFRPLYRLIFRTASGLGNTPKATLEAIDDFRFNAITPVGGGGTTGNFVTIDTVQTITAAKTFSATTTLGPYVESIYSLGSSGTGTVTPNFNNGPVQTLQASGNFTLALPTNMTAGSNLTLIITQDGTGGRVMTANAAYKFAGGLDALSAGISAIDVMTIFYDGTNYLSSIIRNYA